MKITLINPKFEYKKEGCVGGGGFKIPPAALSLIASLTPDDIEINLVDELIEDIDFDADRPDLVGMSVLTQSARRAYTIAGEYKKRGVKVVLGGIHPTIMPDEAIKYADSVVIGEAEDTWPKLIDDFRKGNLKQYYNAPGYSCLENLPVSRRDLLKKNKYMSTNTIHTSRGCPYNCSFCSVTRFYGKTYRNRPIQDIIEEVESMGDGVIIFLDDNIGGNLKYAKTLFKELIPLKKTWISQTSLNTAKDDEFLDLAARSGCICLFIGLESISDSSLKEINKKQKSVVYSEVIKKIHSYKINVLGSLIFGFDSDTENVFERTLNFARENSLAAIQLNVLMPFPGTDLYYKLKTENRMYSNNWWMSEETGYFDMKFEPKQLSKEDIKKGCIWVAKKFYSLGSIASRALSICNKNLESFILFSQLNFGYKDYLTTYSLDKKFQPWNIQRIPVSI